MKAVVIIGFMCCFSSPAAAETPTQKAVMKLDQTDPKYVTPECEAARERALNYSPKAKENAAKDIKSGLLAGLTFQRPMPRAKIERDAVIGELKFACVTKSDSPPK